MHLITLQTDLPTNDEISELQADYANMLSAIIDMLDGKSTSKGRR